MSEKVLYITRGVPGSGKSTWAKETAPYAYYEADAYFERFGSYKFDRNQLRDAHDWCKEAVEEAMKAGITPIVQSNTNIKKWEMVPYIELALCYGYRVEVHHFNGHYTNIHDCPTEVIERMLKSYEPTGFEIEHE